MNPEWLQVFEHEERGFRPVMSFGTWRIAIANDSEWDQKPKDLPFWQRHDETDEVFCLLTGGCVMFVAGCGDAPGEIEAIDMEAGKLYNVRQGAWHARTLDPGSKVLIVENDDTGSANSLDSATTPEQKKTMTALVKELRT